MAIATFIAGLAAPFVIDQFRRWWSGSDKETQKKALKGASNPVKDFFFGTAPTTEQLQKQPEHIQKPIQDFILEAVKNQRVPEFSELISDTTEPNFIGFLTIIDKFLISISAPNFLQASIVAIVSAESNALSTLLLFPASDARKIALCV